MWNNYYPSVQVVAIRFRELFVGAIVVDAEAIVGVVVTRPPPNGC
jgi:hypothetical protein